MASVLILGTATDPHVDSVVKCLCEEQIAYRILDSSDLVNDRFCLSRDGVYFGGKLICDAGVIWNRRLHRAIIPKSMSQGRRRWAQQQFSESIIGGLLGIDAPWVSSVQSMRKASYKPYQLWEAERRHGFNVPEYLVTNDIEKAQLFVDDVCKGSAIFKAVASPLIEEDDCPSCVFTTSVQLLSGRDWNRLKHSPCIFQRRIDRSAEWRVTIVGDQAFPVRIEVPRAVVDYRTIDAFTLPHEAIELPGQLTNMCIGLTKSLDLKYAAIDLVEDEDGCIYFLEINPGGQWKWVEDITGLPISRSLARMLAKIAFEKI